VARLDRPKLWIVAGPNGAGKSTIYANANIKDFRGSVWIINPDVLTVRLQTAESMNLETANLEAVKRIYAWLETSIAAHQTVGVETVLSTDKYRKLVLIAKTIGFEFRLIYVLLRSPEMNVERVKIRVAEGGHDVPIQKILERRERSLKQLPWFLDQADSGWLFDNSDKKPRLIATKIDGTIDMASNAMPEIATAVAQVKIRAVG
jgi:predicted ABC-type ATPase